MRCAPLFCAVMIVLGILHVSYEISAQTEQATETQRDSVGITILAHGGLQPRVDHTPPGQTQRNAPLSFAAELDVLYRLPVDRIALDIGIGGRYLFTRAIDDGQHGYSLLPLYALIQLPFTVPSLERFLSIYLDGKIGYTFFFPDTPYQQKYLDSAESLGGVFVGFGFGTLYQITDLFQIRVLVSYNIHRIETTTSATVADDTFEISLGLGFSF